MNIKNITLSLDDNRRLTGKNLLSDQPGAIIDAFVSGIDKLVVVNVWSIYVNRLLKAVNWSNEKIYSRIFEDGITIAISAPIDALYAACDLNEIAWQLTCEELTHTENAEPMSTAIVRLKAAIAEEVNPKLLALIKQSKAKGIVYLVDDDEFSLGYGTTAQCWPISALPELASINWSQYHSIPLAYVTGTNGKSTSVRIMSQIIEQAGKCCGVTSTDFIRVGDNIIDHGDYSGPGGARMLLRHPNTQTAILEVARGGILRRGLPIDKVDAALITNIAEDHLGQYGINTVAALAQAKAVVAKGLQHNGESKGTLVLNADDEYLVALAPELLVNKCWFSLDENNTTLQQHKQQGDAVCFVKDQQLVYADANEETSIIGVNDIPMTLNGAALHNIQNALGAIGLAKSLDIDNKAIKNALSKFASNSEDNPGRGNQFNVNNAQVIMDFAHNVHSMQAMAVTTANIKAERKFLMLSHAGDRTDSEIINMTKTALKMQPDFIIAVEVEPYLRGRALGEVPQLIIDTALAHGIKQHNIFTFKSPFAGAKYIIEQLQANDLALLMVLSEREEITKLLLEKS
ncbi:Mur ligase family protein [Colwellia sp. MB02u-6]|uniref:Mur ligase family protein n=1 Tax=Colwellia sp. MB02u-6 TaxID=2759824 RepID=UPI001C710F47|nr:Mur ligase family protein [Colwellia sp. MB02u-6]